MKKILGLLLAISCSFALFSCSTPAQGQQGEQGTQGEVGPKGDTGIGILSVTLTSSSGNIDTYTITYSDGTTATFTVTNGADGNQGIQGVPGNDGHTPVITIGDDGFWYIDGNNTGVSYTGAKGDQGEKGDQGDKGDTGKSAYELYCDAHPEYSGTEEQWLDDLASGKLRKITITFNTDGGSLVDDVTTGFGSYVSVTDPTKSGYDFVSWSLNGSMIDVNTYVFFADCMLVAKWKEADQLNIIFNAMGGFVVPGAMSIKYGDTYVLPIASKQYQTFQNWYYLDTLIPNSGTWNYTHENIELTAKYTTSNVYTNLDVDSSFGAVSTPTVSLVVGNYYTLPIPTSLKAGYTFNGWYDGNKKLTNSEGLSYNVCTWTTTVTLRASYSVEIANIYDFMALGGKNLTENYLVTNDLNFNGMAVNSILLLSGTFDGGGHILENFILSTDASSTVFSGLFKTVNQGTIKNLTLKNARSNQPLASGLVGNVGSVYSASQAVNIENISFIDSFNTPIRSIVAGNVISLVNIKNIDLQNTGINAESYCIHSRTGYVERTTISGVATVTNYLPSIVVDGLRVNNDMTLSITTDSGVIRNPYLYSNSDSSYAQYRYYRGSLTISGLNLSANAKFGITSSSSYATADTISSTQLIKVSKSTINGKTNTVWGGVYELSDSVNTGKSSAWGVKLNVRVIDSGSWRGSYEYKGGSYNSESIVSSAILLPDANGLYTYFSLVGEENTLSDADLLNKDFFISALGFNDSIWDFSGIDIANGLFPRLKV